MSTQNKFAVGDKVVWADEFYRGHFYPDCPPDAVLTVVGHDGDHGCECVLLKGPDQMDVEAFEERFKLYEEGGEGGYTGEESFELAEQASEERGMSVNKPDWKDAPSWATVLLRNAEDSQLYAFAEGYREGAKFTRSDYKFETFCYFLLPDCWDVIETRQETLETSNEMPPYLSFFTSVIVAKNKAVSDIGTDLQSVLYDENTTKISLEDDGGGAFLIVEQDYNGAIQQIRLDINEVDAVFSAIKQLVKQLEVNNGN